MRRPYYLPQPDITDADRRLGGLGAVAFGAFIGLLIGVGFLIK